MRIIGLVGHIGAGKTTVANYLESKGYVRITLSTFLLEEARVRGLSTERRDLQDLGDDLRRTHGTSYLATRALLAARAVGSELVVVDGLRNPGEVRALRSNKGTLIVAISRPSGSADHRTRIAIERERRATEPAWGQRVVDSLALADLQILNAGTQEELFEQIDRMVAANDLTRGSG